MSDYYLVFDTESGGIGTDYSLLTCYFGLFQLTERKTFQFIDEFELAVKPDNGVYCISPEGMSINQIDLNQHDKIAIGYKSAGTKLFMKLKEWYVKSGNKLIPVGHVINGDINIIAHFLLSHNSWEAHVSYRTLDTMIIAKFLQMQGKIPADQSLALMALKNYFNIADIPGQPHEAKYDSFITINVLQKLLQL